MRPVLSGDIHAAARALLPLPPQARAAAAARLIAQARAADRYRLRFHKAHPFWGDGTLMAAALAGGVAKEPRPQDPEYQECQSLILFALYNDEPARAPRAHCAPRTHGAPRAHCADRPAPPVADPCDRHAIP